MRRLLWTFVTFFGFLSAATSDARTWRVTPDATGDAPTIQAAIDSAQSGDEILLGPGTYTWTSQAARPFSMLTISKPDLTLRGEAGAEMTILDAEGEWRLLRCENVGNLLIEGLTFQNGVSKLEIGGPGGSTDANRGGAIYVTGNSRPKIRSCIFRDNSAEAGAPSLGGAIHCEVAIIEDCEFTNNRAGATTGNGFGGAIHSGAAQITNCVFRDNRSLGDGSAGGGAIRCEGATIRQCRFENNSSGAHVGAGGGAVFEVGPGTIESCMFTGNRVSARDMSCTGGAVIIGAGTVSDSGFFSNVAEAALFAVARGGAIAAGQFTISRCVFVGNSALRRNPDGPGFGGALGLFEVAGLIENCTLVGNSGGSAEGVGGIFVDVPGVMVHSVILAHTTAGQACTGQGDWSCSNLFGNIEGDVICGTDAGGNFSADPQFCASDPVTSLNVTLQSDSPCAPGQHPDGQSCGVIGAGSVECGTVNVRHRSWSEIKGLYR